MKKIIITLLLLANIACMPAMASGKRQHYGVWLLKTQQFMYQAGYTVAETSPFIKSCLKQFRDNVSNADSRMTIKEFEVYAQKLCKDL